MNVLLWQWSRFGGPPLVAVSLAEGLAAQPDTRVALSLARGAELLQGRHPPRCDLPVATYRGKPGFLWRMLTAPLAARGLARRIAALRPDVAVCAQPGALDLLMALALRRLRIPIVVLVHDADLHPGDGQPFQMQLQRALCRRAVALGALSQHVGQRLVQQGLAGTPQRPLIQLHLPPLPVTLPPPPPRDPQAVHLLSFGRLLPYKGLDLLADALAQLGPQPGLVVRIVGAGPESPELQRLRALPNVTVENRWVPETELGELLAWSDALILPYREASQSGVAAMALTTGRRVVATRVGGLPEQLGGSRMALLCDADPASLADGMRDLLRLPRPLVGAAAPDTGAGWREMARALLDRIEALQLVPRMTRMPEIAEPPA